MAQNMFLRPSAELDACDQRWRYPRWLFVGFGHNVERTIGRRQFLQLAADFFQLFSVKSAAHVPDEAQFLALIQAQQQRAKGKSRGARFGPAANNCIEGLRYLQLHPIRAAVGNIRAVGALGDDSFQTVLLRQLEKLFPMFHLVIGVAKPFRRVQQALQQLLALQQRRFAKIISIAVEKIEREVNDRYLRNQVLARRAHVHAFLQAFEVAVAALIQCHDFSVNNCLRGCKSLRKRRPTRDSVW